MNTAAARRAVDGAARQNRTITAAGRRPIEVRTATDRRSSVLLLCGAMLATLLTACSAPPPVPVTPPGERAGAAVVRKPVAPPAQAPAEAPAVIAPPAAVVIPTGSQYVCVTETDGVHAETAIAFVPKVAELCRRHPEMGPCQYERNLCRRSGGRVYAAGGVEITMATEAEYDKHVLRVRFKSN